MSTFRKAWSGVASLLIVDPVISPNVGNNAKSPPFVQLVAAFPDMRWAQPKVNERAVYMTAKYLTPLYGEELASEMKGSFERERLPPRVWIEPALRPPPVYFETDERTVEGRCCACYKPGPMGRCPNPECGLLVHFTCVPPRANGLGQQCPVCSDEKKLQGLSLL